MTYAQTPADKDALIASFDAENDLLVWSWTGEWRTNVFRLLPDDLKDLK